MKNGIFRLFSLDNLSVGLWAMIWSIFSAILSSLAVVWDVRVAQSAFVLNSFDKQRRLAIGPRRVCVSQEILLYWPWHRIQQRRNACVSVCRVLYTFSNAIRICMHVRKLQISIAKRKFLATLANAWEPIRARIDAGYLFSTVVKCERHFSRKTVVCPYDIRPFRKLRLKLVGRSVSTKLELVNVGHFRVSK